MTKESLSDVARGQIARLDRDVSSFGSLRHAACFPMIVVVVLVGSAVAAGRTAAPAPWVAAQWSEEPITVAEWGQARGFVERFTERLDETRALEPLLDEFFVSDLGDHLRYLVPEITIDHIATNEYLYVYVPSSEVAAEASGEDLEAYFVQTVNFWYLLARRLFSTYPMQEVPREFPVSDLIGGEAMDTLREDPMWRRIVDSPGWSGSGGLFALGGGALINDLETFRHATVTLGAAVLHMRSNPVTTDEEHRYAEYIQQMRPVLESALSRGPSLAAKATVCGSECGSLPSPTRFLEVFAFPLLHLHLVEQEGELRIFYIDVPFD